jgi:hypothetical protein
MVHISVIIFVLNAYNVARVYLLYVAELITTLPCKWSITYTSLQGLAFKKVHTFDQCIQHTVLLRPNIFTIICS